MIKPMVIDRGLDQMITPRSSPDMHMMTVWGDGMGGNASACSAAVQACGCCARRFWLRLRASARARRSPLRWRAATLGARARPPQTCCAAPRCTQLGNWFICVMLKDRAASSACWLAEAHRPWHLCAGALVRIRDFLQFCSGMQRCFGLHLMRAGMLRQKPLHKQGA